MGGAKGAVLGVGGWRRGAGGRYSVAWGEIFGCLGGVFGRRTETAADKGEEERGVARDLRRDLELCAGLAKNCTLGLSRNQRTEERDGGGEDDHVHARDGPAQRVSTHPLPAKAQIRGDDVSFRTRTCDAEVS